MPRGRSHFQLVASTYTTVQRLNELVDALAASEPKRQDNRPWPSAHQVLNNTVEEIMRKLAEHPSAAEAPEIDMEDIGEDVMQLLKRKPKPRVGCEVVRELDQDAPVGDLFSTNRPISNCLAGHRSRTVHSVDC